MSDKAAVATAWSLLCADPGDAAAAFDQLETGERAEILAALCEHAGKTQGSYMALASLIGEWLRHRSATTGHPDATATATAALAARCANHGRLATPAGWVDASAGRIAAAAAALDDELCAVLSHQELTMGTLIHADPATTCAAIAALARDAAALSGTERDVASALAADTDPAYDGLHGAKVLDAAAALTSHSTPPPRS